MSRLLTVMPLNGMENVIKTPAGEMKESGLVRRAVASLTDLFVLVAAVGVAAFFVQAVLSYLVGYWSPFILYVVLCIIALGFFIVPRVFGLRTAGQWALGLRRFRFGELAEYSGKGSLWCVEKAPPKEFTRRTIIVVGFLASFFVAVWLYIGQIAA